MIALKTIFLQKHKLYDVDLLILFANQFAKCKTVENQRHHTIYYHQLFENIASHCFRLTSDNIIPNNIKICNKFQKVKKTIKF